MSNNKEYLLERFTEYLKLKGIRSYKEYIAQLEEFSIYLDDRELDLLSLSLRDAEGYRSSLLDKKICHSTINNKLNKIRCFYAFLDKKDLILSNQLRDLKGLKQSKTLPKNILTIDEMGILLDNLPGSKEKDCMLIVLIELLYGSAIRISEAVGLKVQDINYRNGTITITEFKKGELRRVVPATDISLTSIENYLKLSDRGDEEYVFPRWGKTTIRTFVNRRLKIECDRHNLKHLTSHSFRHSAATSMLRAGAGIRKVQAFS